MKYKWYMCIVLSADFMQINFAFCVIILMRRIYFYLYRGSSLITV